MLKEDDMALLMIMRSNSRMQLTEMSKRTNMPVTTVFEKLKNVERFITKKTTLLDFAKLSYPIRVVYAIKVEDDKREKIKIILIEKNSVNNIFRSSAGFSFVIEAIFKDLNEAHDFSEFIESLKPIKKTEHQLIEEIKKEGFMSI